VAQFGAGVTRARERFAHEQSGGAIHAASTYRREGRVLSRSPRGRPCDRSADMDVMTQRPRRTHGRGRRPRQALYR
jgi:hypothetical protein